MKIGVLGLGIIGAVWARHYHSAGVLAGVWNRTPQPDFPIWSTSAASATASGVGCQSGKSGCGVRFHTPASTPAE